MTSLILIRVNCPSETVANAITEAVIRGRLAPCANLSGPVTSTYVWDGEVEMGQEWVLWIKAHETAWEKIEAKIIELHPDDTPAVLAIPCVRANARYSQWLVDHTHV
ncbi:MAG: divalent-cation tolerance protein CutA [Pseudomonadota bacterium]